MSDPKEKKEDELPTFTESEKPEKPKKKSVLRENYESFEKALDEEGTLNSQRHQKRQEEYDEYIKEKE